MKQSKSKLELELDSVVVLTVLTASPDRRDQIDRVIDKAFASDPRVQVVRVVGYSSPADIAGLASKITEATTAETVPSKNPKLDSVVVITALTALTDRRDQIDRVIDKAFAGDPRVQVVRVVGYSDDIAGLASKITEATTAEATTSSAHAT